MGATSWHYFTSFQADPEAALQQLRSEVFAQGSYVNPAGFPQEYIARRYEQAGLSADSPECRAAIEQVLREQQALETGSDEDLRAVPRASRASLRRVRDLMSLFGQAPNRSRRRPLTIDELLEQAAECGTHSILDITRVAQRREDGAAAPLPASVLQRVFGSPEPTRAQVEEHWDTIAEGLDRWQACYFVVFHDGQAQAYVFIGCSGD